MKGHETSFRMPLGDYERLISQLPGMTLVDATGLVRSLRMVKSEAEIEKITHICTIESNAFACANEIFYEGQPFAETFRAFRMECLAQGADDVPYLSGGCRYWWLPRYYFIAFIAFVEAGRCFDVRYRGNF